jgi:ligand-binding sensor domain-containing protein
VIRPVLWILILLPVLARAQFDPFRQRFAFAEGLSSTLCYDVITDGEGFLWVSTEDGVFRFDGKRFVHYNQSGQLADKVILQMGLDAENRLWFLGLNGSASFYQHGKFFTDRNSPVVKEASLNSSLVRFIPVDETRIILVSLADGYLEISGNQVLKRDAEWFRRLGVKTSVLRNKGFNVDPQGRIWLMDNKMPMRYDNGIFQPAQLPFPLAHLPEKVYLITSRGEWVTVTGNEIAINSSGAIRKLVLEGNNFDRQYFQIQEDRYGRLWMLTANGAYLFETSGNNFYVRKKFLEGKYCSQIYADEAGNTWITTLGDGLYLFPNLNGFSIGEENGLSQDHIVSLALRPRGILLCTSDGSMQEMEFNEVNLKAGAKASLGSYIYSVYNWKNDSLVALTGSGITFLDKDLNPARKLFLGWSKSMTIGMEEEIIVGGGRELISIRGDEKRLLYRFDTENRINAIAADSNNRYWLATDRGLMCYERGKMIDHGTYDQLLSQRINGLLLDQAGTLWLASDESGLIQYASGVAKALNLPINHSDLRVYTLARGIGPNIYAGTSVGLFEINPEVRPAMVRRIGLDVGIRFGKIEDILIKDSLIWVASERGCFALPLSLFIEGGTNVPIRLLDFIAGDSSVSVNMQGAIPYSRNRIDIEFIGINFHSPDDVVYRYRLQPGDQWISTSRNRLSWPKMRPGHYSLEVQASLDGLTWSPEPLRLDFVVRPPWYLTWPVILFLILSLSGLIWLFFRFQLRRRLSKEQEQRRMVEIELKALRSQMNPHFIFNSLSAIQDFIFSHRMEEASEYLSKFSKLIRLILLQSRKQLVTLEEELQLLTYYLELESLRFRDKFDYEITIAKEFDLRRVYIPSLLLQPVAENSVNHAFQGLNRKGLLRISVEPKDSFIVCTVEDNGVGRNHRDRSVTDHVSVGTSIIEERISAFNQLRRGSIRYQSVDLTDEEGKPGGRSTQFIFDNDLKPA